MRLFFAIFALLLLAVTLQPALDILTAGLFYHPQPLGSATAAAQAADGMRLTGFWPNHMAVPNFLHNLVQIGSRVAAALLLIIILYSWLRKKNLPEKKLLGLGSKAATFLLLGLIIGPGLITNTVLKDNWDRARPRQITEFGGTAQFTPYWQPTNQCVRNCSFISGDGALGFYLHALFYLVPPAWRRRTFALGFIGGGLIFGGIRIMMGAHFLSDVLWAGLLMLLSTALLHAAIFGRTATVNCWRSLLAKN